jgi:maleate isomerase
MDVPRGPDRQLGVGVVVPWDFSRDRELWRWAPDDVTLHIARTAPMPGVPTGNMVTELNEPSHLARPTRELSLLGVAVVAFDCTACSALHGRAGERALRRAMVDAGAPRAVTAAGAAVRALTGAGARRVAVVHPYDEEIGRGLGRFLSAAGFAVVSEHGGDLTIEQCATATHQQTYDLAVTGDHPAADAVYLACTGLPTYDLIAPLREHLGKPVITANQATLEAALAVIPRRTGPG